jgi:hypothetical protein
MSVTLQCIADCRSAYWTDEYEVEGLRQAPFGTIIGNQHHPSMARLRPCCQNFGSRFCSRMRMCRYSLHHLWTVKDVAQDVSFLKRSVALLEPNWPTSLVQCLKLS